MYNKITIQRNLYWVGERFYLVNGDLASLNDFFGHRIKLHSMARKYLPYK